MKKEYEPEQDFIKPGMFSEDELPMAELIQRRRLQLLVHSYIYYDMDYNLISDRTYDIIGKQLVELQKDYPEIASRVCYAEVFKEWDGSTGFHLPKTGWVKDKAIQLFSTKR